MLLGTRGLRGGRVEGPSARPGFKRCPYRGRIREKGDRIDQTSRILPSASRQVQNRGVSPGRVGVLPAVAGRLPAAAAGPGRQTQRRSARSKALPGGIIPLSRVLCIPVPAPPLTRPEPRVAQSFQVRRQTLRGDQDLAGAGPLTDDEARAQKPVDRRERAVRHAGGFPRGDFVLRLVRDGAVTAVSNRHEVTCGQQHRRRMGSKIFHGQGRRAEQDDASSRTDVPRRRPPRPPPGGTRWEATGFKVDFFLIAVILNIIERFQTD